MPKQENKCRQAHSGKFIQIFEPESPADPSYIDV